MREHYREEISLEDVTSRFGFSSTYLSPDFCRAYSGELPDLSTDLRVNGAVRGFWRQIMRLEISPCHGFADNRAFVSFSQTLSLSAKVLSQTERTQNS